MSPKRRSIAATLLPCTLLVCTTMGGCFDTTKAMLPVPTKDDVALIDGEALTLTGMMSIREAMKQPATEKAFWVGVAAIAIKNHVKKEGHELGLPTTIAVARYAIEDLPAAEAEGPLHEYLGAGKAIPPPQDLRHDIDQVVARSVVQRNPRVLAELH
jgi:hypothetical protein